LHSPIEFTGLVDWIANPRPGRGVWALHNGRWQYRSYVDLVAQARSVALQLHDLGLPRNKTVGIATSDNLDFLALLFGTWCAGGTVAPFAPPAAVRSRYASYVGRILEAASCETIAVAADGVESELCEAVVTCNPSVRVRPLELGHTGGLPVADPAEIALVQCTSGSTANPRGVEVTESNLGANVNSIYKWLEWSDKDSVAIWLPLHHDMGLIGMVLTSVFAQTDLRLMRPKDFLARPAEWLGCFGKLGATITAAPNFGYERAARTSRALLNDMDFARWRVAVVGAERVLPRTLAKFVRMTSPLGFRSTALCPAYGLAEATLAVSGADLARSPTVCKIERRRAAGKIGGPVTIQRVEDIAGSLGLEPGSLSSCGKPLDRSEVAIVDQSGRRLGSDRLGEVTVLGPSVAQGYRGATSDLPGTRVVAGRLYTGDIGFLHAGELFVLGRRADSFKVRAERIYAEDIEAQVAVLGNLSVGKCAVVPVGAFDDADGISAVVESPRGDWLPEIVALLRGLAPGVGLFIYCVSKGSIPRTTSGKTRRHELWDRLRAGQLDHGLVYSSVMPEQALVSSSELREQLNADAGW
jgi:acyl-CoA synthetase (AMP-forming)/AMP-acid ligase II